MLNIKLGISYADGRKVDVKAGPATQVAFERENNCAIATIATDQRMTYIYWLAWHAAKTGIGFDDWLDTVDEIDVEVTDAVPLPEGQPAVSSSTSP